MIIIRECYKKKTAKAGDQLAEVTVMAILTVICEPIHTILWILRMHAMLLHHMIIVWTCVGVRLGFIYLLTGKSLQSAQERVRREGVKCECFLD